MWDSYIVDPDTDCWIWQRHIDREGYGRLAKGKAAHRAFYTERFGPIPDGMHIDHLCRNRACVNPDHLEVVTPTENQHRSSLPVLMEHEVEEMRHLFRRGMTPSELARLFEISLTAAQAVVRNKTWIWSDDTC